jgi:hypothetical protein
MTTTISKSGFNDEDQATRALELIRSLIKVKSSRVKDTDPMVDD